MGMFSVYWISICSKIQYTLVQKKIEEETKIKWFTILSYSWYLQTDLTHRVEGWVAVPKPEGGGEHGGGHAGARAALYALRLHRKNISYFLDPIG